MKAGSVAHTVIARAFGVALSTITRSDHNSSAEQKAQFAAAQHRRDAAVELRDQGRTWEQIRDTLDLPSISAAYRMVRLARAKL